MSLSHSKGKGYIAALIGGVVGAVFTIVAIVLLNRIFLTLSFQRNSGIALVQIIAIFSAGFGEAFGCFVALSLGNYVKAKNTAIWLVILLIPSVLFFFAARFLLDVMFAASLTVISLPLIARALTRHPNYPERARQALDTYAKNPPTF
jgi:hypothetical protein